MKKKIKLYGLVGRDISYSFSEGYFTEKFRKEGRANCEYVNFDISDISLISDILEKNQRVKGFNVTIPYKEEIIPLLNKISKTAKAIGAVNTVVVSKKGWKGYNTDHYGFRKSLKPLLKPHHTKALILGTGGASKAVAFALRKLNIEYDFVSRNPSDVIFSYDDIDEDVFNEYQILINTTPLGTFPDINKCPPLPYHLFTEEHIAFDLVYNPAETEFLKRAAQQGAVIQNGYDMLVLQAEKAWAIWNRK